MSDDRARAMIANPDHWPHRPKLPLMRQFGAGSLVDCGYLVEGHGLTVFIGNIRCRQPARPNFMPTSTGYLPAGGSTDSPPEDGP